MNCYRGDVDEVVTEEMLMELLQMRCCLSCYRGAVDEVVTEEMLMELLQMRCCLKGHGNEADFLGFLHKSVRHRSLTLHFEPFRF